MYVDDVNDFHVQCLGRPHGGGTFNLGSGEDHSVREIFEIVIAGGYEYDLDGRLRIQGEACTRIRSRSI